MTAYGIYEDELYPYCRLFEARDAPVPETALDLTPEEVADYKRVGEEWKGWQMRMRAAIGYPLEPSTDLDALEDDDGAA